MTLKVQSYQIVCSRGACWTSRFRSRDVNSGLAMTSFQVGAMLRAVITRLVPLAVALLCLVDATRAEYRLATGDVVEFAVTGMTELRTRALIQSDSAISLPIVGTVRVAGLTQLTAELDEKDEFEPPALASLPLAEPRMAELMHLESRLFEIRKRDSRQEEASLRRAIKQDDLPNARRW